MQRKFTINIRKHDLSGQITVFLSLMLTVVMVFLLTCTEGVHIYLGKGRAMKCVISAGESVLADYDSFLWEEYHIFAVDRTYGTGNALGMNCHFQEYLLDNLNPDKTSHVNLYNYLLENTALDDMIYLSDEEGMVLKHQIVQYMKYQIGEDTVAKLIDIAAGTASTKAVDEAKEKVALSDQKVKEEEKLSQKEKETSEKTQTKTSLTSDKNERSEATQKTKQTTPQSDTEQEEVEDPRDTLKHILQFGIVELVTGRKDISKADYAIEHVSSGNPATDAFEEDDYDESKEENVAFETADEITSRLEQKYATSSLTNEVISEALVYQYIMEHFDNAVQKKVGKNAQKTSNTEEMSKQKESETSVSLEKKTRMEMETEYIIAGKNSDYKNVKSIIYRLLAIRFPINFTYALTDAELQASAETLAVALAGVTANPAVVKLVQYLLLACISYAEAIYDIQCLYQGQKVELTKTKANWKLRFSNIAQLAVKKQSKQALRCGGAVEAQKGMAYGDYLRLLMMLQKKQSKKYSRMLDVMQINGQQQKESFQIQNMVYGFQIDSKIRLKPVFCNVFTNVMEGSDGTPMTFYKYLSY